MIEFHISAHECIGEHEKLESQTMSDQTTAEKVFDRLVLKYEADIAVGDAFVMLIARKPQ